MVIVGKLDTTTRIRVSDASTVHREPEFAVRQRDTQSLTRGDLVGVGVGRWSIKRNPAAAPGVGQATPKRFHSAAADGCAGPQRAVTQGKLGLQDLQVNPMTLTSQQLYAVQAVLPNAQPLLTAMYPR